MFLHAPATQANDSPVEHNTKLVALRPLLVLHHHHSHLTLKLSLSPTILSLSLHHLQQQCCLHHFDHLMTGHAVQE